MVVIGRCVTVSVVLGVSRVHAQAVGVDEKLRRFPLGRNVIADGSGRSRNDRN
jgi:D-alanyl-D-alanine carboxypeptidase